MLEAWLRPKIQTQYLDQSALWLHEAFGILPNHITALACLTGILVCPLLIFKQTGMAVLCLCATGYLDVLDGTLARLLKRSNPMGAIFDLMSDRVVECAVILGLYGVAPDRGWACLWILSAIFLCVSAFLLVGLFSSRHNTNKSFYYSPGLIERTEAFCFFALMMLWPTRFHFLAGLFTFLVCLTAGLHLRAFYKQSEKAD